MELGRGARALGEVGERQGDRLEGLSGAVARDGAAEPGARADIDGQLSELALEGTLDEGDRLGPGERRREATQHVAHRGGHALDVRGVAEPLDDEGAGREARQPRADRIRREPVLLDHGDDALDDLRPPGGNDRRVRDREPERMAKEGGHGEPVREPADRRRLETRRDDPEPGRAGEGPAPQAEVARSRAARGQRKGHGAHAVAARGCAPGCGGHGA